jgi:hypothetical protein
MMGVQNKPEGNRRVKETVSMNIPVEKNQRERTIAR